MAIFASQFNSQRHVYEQTCRSAFDNGDYYD